MLVARDVDVILGMECSAAPRRDDTRFHREELLGDILDAVLPTDHPLAGPRADRPRRARPTRSGSRRRSAGRATRCSSPAAAPPGFSPRVAHRAGDWQAVMGLVAGGLGISLVPRLAHTAPPAGVVIIPLTGEPPKRHVFVACRAGAESSPAIRAVLDAVADTPAQRSPHERGARAGVRALPASTPSEASRQASFAVVFDLDGVLVDSEQVWDQSRRDVVAAHGGTWKDSATRDMLGMSSPEWSAYVVEELGAQLTPEEVNAAVVEAMLAGYRERLPLLPGAREAVERVGAQLPARARVLLQPPGDRPRARDGWASPTASRATVSSEEVARGKPAPDVYEEVVRRLGVSKAAAIEDSEAGIRSAHAAGLRVIAIPNPHFPPSDEALALADEVRPDLDALSSKPVSADDRG